MTDQTTVFVTKDRIAVLLYLLRREGIDHKRLEDVVALSLVERGVTHYVLSDDAIAAWAVDLAPCVCADALQKAAVN
jgi:hypothetical protein